MTPDTDTRREIRRIIWTLLVFGAVMSLAGNVVHAVIQHGWSLGLIGPVVAAAIPPAALLGLMHLMGVWSRWTESDGASYWVFLAGVIGLGAAAFRLSFAALQDLAMTYGYGRVDAALFPLILDGLMTLMTWGLVAATRPKAVHQVEPEQPMEPPVHTTLAPASAPAPELTLEAVQVVHQPEPAPEQPAEQLPDDVEQSVHQPSAPAVTSDDDPVQTPEQAMHQEYKTDSVQASERPRLVSVHRVGAPGSVHRSKPAAKVQQRTTSAPEQSDDPEPAPPVQPVHTAQAEAAVQAGGIDLSVATVAEIYARVDAGQSASAMDRTKVANKRTVAKLLARREELSVVAEAEDPDRTTEPALA